MAVIGTQYSQALLLDAAGEIVTRIATYVDGSAVTWAPAFTSLGSGRYLMTFTPTQAGSHAGVGVRPARGKGTMRIRVAPGWDLEHITDRVVRLRKDDILYRRFTGADGKVVVRVEPQMTRDQALTKAVQMAERNDAELGLKVASGMMPSQVALARLRRKQKQLAQVFGVPGQEASERIYKP